MPKMSQINEYSDKIKKCEVWCMELVAKKFVPSMEVQGENFKGPLWVRNFLLGPGFL
jgi:hypothetical protein